MLFAYNIDCQVDWRENVTVEDLIKVAKSFSDDVNTELLALTHFYVGNDTFVPVHDITVKQLQTLLKSALSKTTKTEFERKLQISNFDPDCIVKVRKQISNVKLRNIFYRLINNDFLQKLKCLNLKWLTLLNVIDVE